MIIVIRARERKFSSHSVCAICVFEVALNYNS